MLAQEVSKQAQKTGQPPGTLTYTGEEKTTESQLTLISYGPGFYQESRGVSLEQCFASQTKPPDSAENTITWLNIEGLGDISVIQNISQHYNLHPLTIEDILNVQQRSKVEEFEGYFFVTLRVLLWDLVNHNFSTKQLSLVVGKDFVLSFHERSSDLFSTVDDRLRMEGPQRLRQHGSDYLMYRLIDIVVDQYFVVLEALGDRIEVLEEQIISNPSQKNARMLHHLKRQVLLIRKSVWPMREAISHLLQVEGDIVSSFTRLYLRDVYDHTMQAIDSIEIFRDMLAGILDVYLSSLTNRMNEVMKVLTIIATIFIPMTFLTGVFGMNFKYMPVLDWHWGYYASLGCMFLVALIMLYFFRRKKWI